MNNSDLMYASLKIPPHNLEAEQALIGAVFVNSKIIPAMANVFNPEWLYKEAHQHILTALFRIKSNDLIMLKNDLEKQKMLERSGGIEYISSLVNIVSTSSAWKFYADLIKDKWKRRQLIMTCSEVIDHSYRDDTQINDVLSMNKLMLLDISKDKEILKCDNKALYTEIYDNVYNKKSFMGHSLGIADIKYTLEPKTTTVIAAESGVGKSSISLQIADNVSKHGKVLYFSLESTVTALARRQLARKSRVALTRIRNSNIEYASHHEQINKAINELINSNVWIIDNTEFSCVEKARSFCESVSLNEKIQLIVFDYLQLMYTIQKTGSRHLEISYITRELNALAKDLDVPIIYVSQLTKNIDGERPMLSNLKESGDIRNNADNIIFLWGPDSHEARESRPP